jgi:hypothetical protein
LTALLMMCFAEIGNWLFGNSVEAFVAYLMVFHLIIRNSRGELENVEVEVRRI